MVPMRLGITAGSEAVLRRAFILFRVEPTGRVRGKVPDEQFGHPAELSLRLLVDNSFT